MTTRLLIEELPVLNETVGAVFALSKEDSHYIAHVLRLGPGDQLVVVHPASNTELLVRIARSSTAMEVEILSISQALPSNSAVKALIYPLTKGSTLELVLEKGCELGVPHFMIWQAERSVVRLGDQGEREKKIERWRKILRASAQQSQKSRLPGISLFSSLDELISALLLEQNKPEVLLTCSLESNALPIAERALAGKSHGIAVGPEGDFSPRETELLEQSGFLKTSLGPYRLRAETAAIAATAMIAGICGFSTPHPAR